MKTRGIILTLGLGIVLGVCLKPGYQYLYPPEPKPQPPPELIKNEEIVTLMRKHRFLVSFDGPVKGKFTVKAGTDVSSNKSGTSLWDSTKKAYYRATTRNRITLRVYGTAEAGVDLRNFGSDGIIRNDHSALIIDIGEPVMRHVHIDSQSIKTMRHEIGSFNLYPDVDLPFRALGLAEKTLEKAACKKGAKKLAGVSGQEFFEDLFELMRAQNDNRTIQVRFTVTPCQ